MDRRETILLSNLLEGFQPFWPKISGAMAKSLSLPESVRHDAANHAAMSFSFSGSLEQLCRCHP
jgi:hypothetical protein